ncbi:MAG: thiamine-phosphate kinase [Pseudomonadota bacterium]|jgi:thiamine-monophosphate kinase
MNEFELIAQYFTRPARAGGAVRLGVGDDCAMLDVPPGETLAISTDMLVEGRHFFEGTDPEALGHKALAVNLSDLAAMGAAPLGFSLALALPAVDPGWLEGFARGLLALADAHGAQLIGGDTTRGPLNICITVYGSLPPQSALRRDGAHAGDEIWVSGTLGDARLGLEALQGKRLLDRALLRPASARLHRPEPRVGLGLALRRIAHAAIDVSDGLMGDLAHILERSRVGAVVDADALPCGEALSAQDEALRRAFALNGGDDYELCFTAAPRDASAVQAAAQAAGVRVTRIGTIVDGAGLQIIDADGQALDIAAQSFDHFSG